MFLYHENGWGENITEVKLDGVPLTLGIDYIIAPVPQGIIPPNVVGTNDSLLAFFPTLFQDSKNYTIKITAAGYPDVTVNYQGPFVPPLPPLD